MKNAGKACNNRLYRHIRTFEKIIKNYFVIYYKQHKKNSLYFFVTPFILFLVNFIGWIQKYVVLALIVSGVSAPFHYVLPDLIFPGDKYHLIMLIFPLAICWIAFKIGERVGIYFKERI